MVALVALAACAPPEPARAIVAPPAADRLAAPSPPVTPARWIATGGATRVGPETPRGLLVLIGGRRALVDEAGVATLERAPSPEPLIEVTEVPSPAGARLVARGQHGVYRLDDPLGAPTTLAWSEVPLARLGAWPGLGVVWDVASPEPRFLDVATGEVRAAPRLPELPIVAVAFRDAKEGAAVFEGAGPSVTTDGGATWRPLAVGASPGDALHVTGLRAGGGALRAFAHADGREADVDPARASIGRFELPGSAAGDPPIVRWARTTGRDPVDAAVVAGVPTAAGEALVASHGLVARLDPASGAVIGVFELARGTGMNACALARAGRTAWIACALTERSAGDLYDPFGVFHVDLAGKIGPDRPTLARNGEAELRVSPSGGAMLIAPCSADEPGEACVRQPDGKWRTVDLEADAELADHGAGPLADGRFVLLRGLTDGDEGGEPARAGGGPRPRLVVVDAAGKERELAPVAWSSPAGPLRVESPIEEDEEGAIRFALSDGETAATFAVGPGAETATPLRIAGATRVRLHAGRGIAVGEGRVLASVDAGATFVEVAAPPAVREAASRVARAADDPGALAVGELGARIEGFVRLGWGPDAALPGEAARGGAQLEARTRPPERAAQVLACTVEGDVARGSAPAFATTAEARALLDPKAPPARGVRREIAAPGGARAPFVPEAAVSLEQTGPAGGAPDRWTVRWIDPLEIGAKVRSWSGPAPAGAAWGAALRGASASDGRAVATVRTGGRTIVVRVGERGDAEVVEPAFELLPGADVAFGPDDRSPTAWLREDAVVVWPKGAAPRVAAHLAGRAWRAVGGARADGLIVVIGDDEASFARAVPLDAARIPSTLPLDGWARLPPLRAGVRGLPACGPRPTGARVIVPRARLPVAIAGQDGEPEAVVADVRVGPAGACLAGAAVAIGPGRPGSDRPIAFLRVDLAGHRAEGAERGAQGGRPFRRLSCQLAPRP